MSDLSAAQRRVLRALANGQRTGHPGNTVQSLRRRGLCKLMRFTTLRSTWGVSERAEESDVVVEIVNAPLITNWGASVVKEAKASR